MFFIYLFLSSYVGCLFFFFFQAEDGIRDDLVTGVQTCALPISSWAGRRLRHEVIRMNSAEQHHPVKDALEGKLGCTGIAGFARGDLSDGGLCNFAANGKENGDRKSVV